MSIDKRKILESALGYTQQGKLDRAIGEYQAVLKADPNDLNVLNILGDLYARTGNKAEAIAHYMRLGDAYKADGLNLRAIAVYKKVVKLDPSYIQAYLACADLYAEQGLAGEARVQLQSVADQYLKGNDLARALTMYERMIQLDPGNAQVVTKVADLLVKTGRTADALGHLNTLGEHLVGFGQLEEAQQVYQKMVQLQPTPQGWLQMARVQIRTGSREGAKASLRQAEALATADPTAWVALGRVYREMGEDSLAEQWLQRARESGHPEGRLLLLELYQEAGRWTEVFEELRHADDLLQGEHGEALQRILDRLMEGLPEEAGLWSHLVEILERMGSSERLITAQQHLSRLSASQEQQAFTPAADAEVVDHPQPLEAIPPEPGPSLPSEGMEEIDGADDPSVGEQLAEADVYARYGLQEKAIQHLRRLLARFPGNIPSRQKLMQLLLERGERDEAVREGRVLLEAFRRRGDDQAVGTLLETLRALTPHDPDVPAELPHAAPVVAQDPPREEAPPPAEMTLGIIEPLPTEDPSGERLEVLVSSDVEEELAEGDFYREQGMVEEARAIFQRILLRDPGHQGAKARLAGLAGRGAMSVPDEITEGEGEAPEGDTPIFKMTVPQPLEEDYVDLAGELSEELSEEEEVLLVPTAKAEIEAVLHELQRGVREHVEAEDSETHYNLGIAYKDMELFDEAIEEFRRASQDPAYRLRCSSLLGLCYLAKGEPMRAVAELQRGLHVAEAGTEERWGILYDLATAHEAVGDLSRALEALTMIQREIPKFRDIRTRIRDLRGRLDHSRKPPRQRITFI